MANDFWLNLPVKDVVRSRDFFVALGFRFADGPGNSDVSAPLLVGSKNVVVMLFQEAAFRRFVNQDVADTTRSSEVLLSFDAVNKEEVDELALKVLEAGGATTHKPYAMEGPMYGCIFSDPDGHKWNVLYMRSGK